MAVFCQPFDPAAVRFVLLIVIDSGKEQIAFESVALNTRIISPVSE